MALYRSDGGMLRAVQETTFAEAGIGERRDLQRWIRANPGILGEELLVIAEEYAEFEESRRRIDLLAIDQKANLVIIELKRTEDGGHMELQAIRYAAMVQAMTFARAVSVYASASGVTVEAAQEAVLRFLGWEEPSEDAFAQQVRILLCSAEFGRELTGAVLWLREYGIDIRCIRVKPYQSDSRELYLDVQAVIPLPEAEDYQVKLREKAESERTSRETSSSQQEERLTRFWQGVLALAASRGDRTHAHLKARNTSISATTGHGRNIYYGYAIGHRGEYRVELSIWGSDFKQKFDAIARDREQIEEAFGKPLVWERGDDHARSAWIISAHQGPSLKDEEAWPQVQDLLVTQMLRFMKALGPTLGRLPPS
jgi:hypothetical protein